MRPGFRAGAPRPLAAHVAAGVADLQQGAALAARLDDPRFPWRASLRAEVVALSERLRTLDRAELARAVASEGARALGAALDGVAAYQDAAPPRRPAEPPVVWRAGAARLLDYGAGVTAAEGAPPLLALPSLVNSPRILDLTRARSLLRGLARRGVRPFLLDWGDPGPEERGFDLGAYLERRVGPALAAVTELGGGAAAILGHCMSGALAAAAAQAWPRRTRCLALLAAPWDFAPMTPPAAARPRRSDLERLIGSCGAVFGGVPSDLLNTLFFLRDPLQATRKFPAFAVMRRAGPRGRLFVAVEDWLNDGLRLAAPAARELFLDWGLDNTLGRGLWRPRTAFVDRSVRPSRLDRPLLVAASAADTVTPEVSALAALDGARRASRLAPRAGHVGMIVGRRAEQELWDPLADWLKSAGR